MKTDLFFGMTDREFVAAAIMEMRRRSLYGCVFAFPSVGGPSVFASSSPEGTVADLTAAKQLTVFAEVASMATTEKPTKIVDPPKSNEWVN